MPKTFRDLIVENKRKSLLLVVMFCLFVTAVAMVLALGVMAYVNPSMLRRAQLGPSLAVGAGAAVLSFLISLVGYYAGADAILAVSRARRIHHQDDPELFNVVEEMAIAAGVPMPAVYVIDDVAPNAFATGRDPAHAAVTVTTGLRQKLTRDELQGVIAHEMSHIRNYDIRLMLLMAVLVGTVVMLADFFWRIAWYSPRDRRDRDNGKEGANLFALAVIIVAVILAIIAPFLAQLIQLAVSRQREYLADASGVELTRNPLGLAHALQKIDADPNDLKEANRGTAHLFIANPIKKFEARAATALASHPPIKDRIRRLMALAHTAVH